MVNQKIQKQLKIENSVGFTIIEVLIAVVILAAGLLGMAALTVGIMQGNNHSSHLTTATVLAQEKMEEIMRLGYDGTAASDTTTTEDYNSIGSYIIFKRVTVVDVDSPASDMKTVTVTVYWDADDKSMIIQTLLAT